MARRFELEISQFSRKYFEYVGWYEGRYVDLTPVVKQLKRWHWQGELPTVWYEICQSIDELSPMMPESGIPYEIAHEDGFKGWGMYFVASDGDNCAWVSEEMRNYFGCNFGPIGLFEGDAVLLVDDYARFYTYDEGWVKIYEQGIGPGFDSLFRCRYLEKIKLPYSSEDWEERFPNPLR